MDYIKMLRQLEEMKKDPDSIFNHPLFGANCPAFDALLNDTQLSEEAKVRELKTLGELRPENIQYYVAKLQAADAKECVAEKTGAVIAHLVTPEEAPVSLEVYTKNGNLEATEHVDAGKVIVTRADMDTQKPVIDSYGHTNSWSMDADKFQKKYDNPEIDGFSRPKGGLQKFIQIPQDLTIYVPWGENGSLVPQNLKAGSYLNITNPKDVYGIAQEEFQETYRDIKAEIPRDGTPSKWIEFMDKHPYFKETYLKEYGIFQSTEKCFELGAMGLSGAMNACQNIGAALRRELGVPEPADTSYERSGYLLQKTQPQINKPQKKDNGIER